jgi:AhpD family alkylhydroperoxidase
VRLNTFRVDPDGYQRLLAWNTHLSEGPLEPALLTLVEARASQINGCAFCLAMHLDDARETGIEQYKLDALAAWRDVTSFDPRERAALALTEAMTRIADRGGVEDAVWDSAREQFDDAELTTLLQVIALINAFNRINVTTERSAEDYVEFKNRHAKPKT